MGGIAQDPVRARLQALQSAPGQVCAPPRPVRAAAGRPTAPSLIAVAGDFMAGFRQTAVTMFHVAASPCTMLRPLLAAVLLAATSPLAAQVIPAPAKIAPLRD